MAIVSRSSVIALLTVVCLLHFAVSIDQKQLLVNIETGISKEKPTAESDKMFLHKEKTKLVKDVLGMLSSSRVGLVGNNKPTQRTSKSTSFLPPRFQGSRGHLQSEPAVSKPSPNHFAASPCDHSMSDFLARCVFEDHATP